MALERAKALRNHTHSYSDVSYDQTAAEIAANVPLLAKKWVPGHIYRYGGSPSAAASVNDTAITAMLAVCASHRGIVPAGIYQVTAPQVIPNGGHIDCDANAQFYYTDTVSTGAYFLTNGIADTRGGNLYTENLSIVLRTGTAKGIKLLNSIDSTLRKTYVEGFIPADWATSSVAINARTNIGLRIETSVSTDSFFNEFDGLYINHCHTGVSVPGGITGKQYFRNVSMFGDSIYGDTTSVGFDVAAAAHTEVDGCYMDAYGNGSGGGAFRMTGPQAASWRITNPVFDAEPGAATVGTITSGVTVPMLAIGFFNSGGNPTDNSFLGCVFGSGTSVTDVTASAGNFVEDSPNLGQVWTATLVPQTSGSITLNSGAGGDRCFCEKRGSTVRVWGVLTVASVSAPVGSLQIQGLPFTVANDNSNRAACTIRADLLQATATTALQGYANRNSTVIVVEKFAAGAASNCAADFKANSEMYFNCTYVGASD